MDESLTVYVLQEDTKKFLQGVVGTVYHCGKKMEKISDNDGKITFELPLERADKVRLRFEKPKFEPQTKDEVRVGTDEIKIYLKPVFRHEHESTYRNLIRQLAKPTVLVAIITAITTITIAFIGLYQLKIKVKPTAESEKAPLESPSQPSVTVETGNLKTDPDPTLHHSNESIESSTLQWCDDFDKGIDYNRWSLLTDVENLIYAKNGVLNFGITSKQSKFKKTVGACLTALPIGQLIKEVSFTITLKSYEGKVSGGAGVKISMEDDRDHAIMIGPSPNGPEVEFYICEKDKSPCGEDYEDYSHPYRGYFKVGAPVTMKVVWTGKKVEFYINHKKYYMCKADKTPIIGLHFDMFVDSGSVFQATVDDLCVKYVED